MFKAMPGKSFTGPLPPLTESQEIIKQQCKGDIKKIAHDIGERNFKCPEKLAACADFIGSSLSEAGYTVKRQEYQVGDDTFCNLDTEIKGTDKPEELIIIGAHYDSVVGTPGADDNASGIAGLLYLARRFAGKPLKRSLRFVAFVNEEPPFFHTGRMGSMVYAKRCRKRSEHIIAMMCLESIGYYSPEQGSQRYPFPLNLMYPSTGHFIGFVGNLSSSGLVRKAIGIFREHAGFPSEGAVLPSFLPGVSWSDQWAFWKKGFHAFMVTDTAPFRNPYYHTAQDTPDKLDYESTARVMEGLGQVIQGLVGIC